MDTLLAGTTPKATPSQGVKANAIANGGAAVRGSVLTALVEQFLALTDKANSAVIDVSIELLVPF